MYLLISDACYWNNTEYPAGSRAFVPQPHSYTSLEYIYIYIQEPANYNLHHHLALRLEQPNKACPPLLACVYMCCCILKLSPSSRDAVCIIISNAVHQGQKRLSISRISELHTRLSSRFGAHHPSQYTSRKKGNEKAVFEHELVAKRAEFCPYFIIKYRSFVGCWI